MGSHRWLRTPLPRFSKDLLESLKQGIASAMGLKFI